MATAREPAVGDVPGGQRCPYGRNSQLIADVESRIGSDLAPIHANLAAAQDPVDVALRHPLQDLDEVVVDALPLPVLAHCKPVDSILA